MTPTKTKPASHISRATALQSKYAAWPSLAIYDRLGVPYIVTSQDWDGPLWLGHAMVLSTSDSFGDPGFFHEAAHWVLASPAQRLLPDLGLGRQVNARASIEFTSSSTPWQNDPSARRTATHNVGWGEPTVARTTAAEQEAWACHVLALYEPAVGLWSWDGPPANAGTTINDALSDFAGSSGPKFNRRIGQGLAKRFSGTLLDATPEQIVTYLARLQDVLTQP